jgi:hypothetical protein
VFGRFLNAAATGGLTASEATQLRPKLIQALLGSSESLDDLLTTTNRRHAQAEIWSTMDQQDAETLADALLMFGRKSAIGAGIVRGVAQGYLGFRALTILGPRLWQTAKWYPENGGIGW